VRVFLLVSFGFGLLGAIIKSMTLMFKEYPRVEKFTLGEDVARLVEGVAITMWAAYLLWG
jgi:hypothetical protein